MISDREQDFMLYFSLFHGSKEKGAAALRAILSIPEQVETLLASPAALTAIFSGGQDAFLRDVMGESAVEERALLAFLKAAGIPAKDTIRETMEDPTAWEAVAARPDCLNAVRGSVAYTALDRNLVCRVCQLPADFKGNYPGYTYQDANWLYLYKGDKIWRAPIRNPTGLVRVGTLPQDMQNGAIYVGAERIYLYAQDKILWAEKSDPTAFTRSEKSLPYQFYYGQSYADEQFIYLYGTNAPTANQTKIMRAAVSAPDVFQVVEGKNLPIMCLQGALLEAGAFIYIFGGNNPKSILRASRSDPTDFELLTQTLPYNFQYGALFAGSTYVYLYGGTGSNIYRAPLSDPTGFVASVNLPETWAYTTVAAVGDEVFLFGAQAAPQKVLSAPGNQAEQMTYELGQLPTPIVGGVTLAMGDYVYLYTRSETNTVLRAPIHRPWRMKPTSGTMRGASTSNMKIIDTPGGKRLVGRSEGSNPYAYLIRASEPMNPTDGILMSGVPNLATGLLYETKHSIYQYDGNTVTQVARDTLTVVNTASGNQYLPKSIGVGHCIFANGRDIYLYGTGDTGDGILRARAEDPFVFAELSARLPATLKTTSAVLAADATYLYLLGVGASRREILRAKRAKPTRFERMEQLMAVPLDSSVVAFQDKDRVILYQGTVAMVISLL